MRRTNLDPVERARTIVNECLAREFYARGTRFAGGDFGTLLRAFEIYRATFGVAAPDRGRMGRTGAYTFERVAALILSCVVALVGAAWIVSTFR